MMTILLNLTKKSQSNQDPEADLDQDVSEIDQYGIGADDEDEGVQDGMEDNLLGYTDIDESQEQTADNLDLERGFFTTQAGDLPAIVEHRPGMDRVSGHVLYNQAAVCTTRFDKRIKGSNAQRAFIQKFCNTAPGEPCPLLSLEQCLHPRIVYAAASADDMSILGAMPTWLYGPKKHNHGFASLPNIVRSRLTASGSLTSSDKHYQFHLFDVLSNKALSNGDSRQVINRGFQVDATKPIGLSVRNSNESGMTECVDSHKMVRGLAAAQEYHKFSYFITLTCNHSKTPGVSFLDLWKRSDEWKSSFPNWNSMHPGDKEELRTAMDEASGPILLRNWVEVRTLFLLHLKQKFSLLGAPTLALFSRDEYQPEKGNLFHEHLVGSADLEHLPSGVDNYLEDLCRTSVLEVIKTDEIESLIRQGLVRDYSHYEEIVRDASKFLTHRCDPRCQRRVDHTGDPKKDLYAGNLIHSEIHRTT